MVNLCEFFLKEVKYLKVDGLAAIFDSKRYIARFLWLCVLLVFTSLCVYLIVSSINEYKQYHVTTTYRLVIEEEAVFPTITICNMNLLESQYAINTIDRMSSRIPSYIAQNRERMSILDFAQNYLAYLSVMLMLENIKKATTGSYFNANDKRTFFDLNRTMLDCQFAGDACDANDFEFLYHPTYFTCYRFNSGFDSSGARIPLKKVNKAGLTNDRFSMQLYAGTDNLIGDYVPARGFLVLIHNATDNPKKGSPSGMFATPGTGMLINVKRYSNNQYTYPYSECTVSEDNELSGEPLSDSSLFDQTVLASNFSYSRSVCLLACAQYHIVRECNCTFCSLGFTGDGQNMCLSQERYACAFKFYSSVFLAGDFVKLNCLQKCPLECHTPVMRPTVSNYDMRPLSRNMSTNAYVNSNLKNVTENLVEFSVFYDSLSYTIVEEKPKMTSENLVGSIGGHLHLFLGMSLMSFLELFDLSVSLLYFFCKNKLKPHFRFL